MMREVPEIRHDRVYPSLSCKAATAYRCRHFK